MNAIAKGLTGVVLAVSMATAGVQAAGAIDRVSLSVKGPTSASKGQTITFKLKLGKSVQGSCYANEGTTMKAYTKINGSSTQLKVAMNSSGNFNFICAGKTFGTDFQYVHVNRK